ncbi:MAG: hypothetical protein CVV57_01580 [Tenericutes bacterium HGW-Tenericutes-2]|jgi:hypothetical protein|nr:MAG: hypothetical protein CVV57_01580 [Tenericutes bacterium HGW-Tenericutes-2]
MSRFNINDIVLHKLFGTGKVLEQKSEETVFVAFDNPIHGKKLMSVNFLKLHQSFSNSSQDNLQDSSNDQNSKVISIPKKFQDSSFLTSEDRAIYRHVRKVLNQGFISIGTNPLIKTEMNKIGIVICPDKGVFIFSIFDKVNEPSQFYQVHQYIVEHFMTSSAYKMKQWLIETDIFRRNQEYDLKFPIFFGAVFPNLAFEQVKYNPDLFKYGSHIFFKDLKNNTFKNINDLFAHIKSNYKFQFSIIDDNLAHQLIYKIHPEYCVAVFEDNKNKTSQMTQVSKKEMESRISAFILDEEQIHLINEIKTGYYLTLANPGSGKSVILLSQAYRLSCIQDDSVLITCYNRNLRDRYDILKDLSGFNNRPNLSIYTFHQLLRKLMDDVSPGFQYDDNHPDLYDISADLVYDYLSTTNSRYKFKAVFIDEIQLFDPKWIEICYMLLEKPVEGSYLQMYGDLNQDVRAAKRKGKASWQNTNLDFRGRVKVFRKNYRNTHQIHEYLQSMIGVINDRLEKLDLGINTDDSSVSTLITVRKGLVPRVIKTDKTQLAQIVFNTIDTIAKNNNISYNDIAVLYPFRSHRYHDYLPVTDIQKLLNEQHIPFCEISGEGKQAIFEAHGVTFCTIDSSLGLDFKVVILTALYPMNFIYTQGMLKIPPFSKLRMSDQKHYYDDFIKYARQIYTAASRARDILVIVDDLGEDSVYHDQIILDRKDLYECY